MNKDVLVYLLQKDIKELSLLTEGFESMDAPPEALLKLAKEKAENIERTLSELADLSEINDDVPEQLSQMYDNVALVQDKAADDYLNKTVCTTSSKPEEENFCRKNYSSESMKESNTDSAKKTQTKEITDNEEIISPIGAKNPFAASQSSVVLNDALSSEDHSVNHSMASQKIEDIRSAINIGDRFRFQRELFGGNGEVLNKTISYLNDLAQYDEAERFLRSKFGWAEDNVHAEDFLKIVKRRYLQ